MDFFDLLTLIGGLSLFLFGMNIMGQALELHDKDLAFSGTALRELGVLSSAVSEVLALSVSAFRAGDLRAADHCSNIAACLIDMQDEKLNLHESQRAARSGDPDFLKNFTAYEKKYALS